MTAERVSICDECLVVARATRSFFEKVRAFFFEERDEPALPSKASTAYRDSSHTACSFCHWERAIMLAGSKARICRPCVRLAHDVVLQASPTR